MTRWVIVVLALGLVLAPAVYALRHPLRAPCYVVTGHGAISSHDAFAVTRC